MMATCDVSDAALKAEKDLISGKTELDNGDSTEEQVDPEEEEYDEGDDTEDTEIHPLQNRWALWFYKNDRNNSWTENLKKVVDFATVEEFWGLINHISPAAQLPIGCDYSLFKTGVEPMWEDKANISGGRWLISLDKTQRLSVLNTYWLDILMLLIGEAFDEDSDEICGAVVNIRNKGDRLSVWTANCENEDAIRRIGKKIKDSLKLKVSMSYQSHDDQQNKTGSKARSTFTI